MGGMREGGGRGRGEKEREGEGKENAPMSSEKVSRMTTRRTSSPSTLGGLRGIEREVIEKGKEEKRGKG